MPCNIRPGCFSDSTCPDKWGCVPGVCPDFEIKRHDTKPSFKVAVEDCDGPLDLTGLIVEANMWAKAKLKCKISATDNFFGLADDIGFEQMMVGDIIIMERARLPEYMLIEAFDEDNRFVQVERGYAGSTPSCWKKGACLRIMKMMNSPAESEMVIQDIMNIDGTSQKNQLTQSFLVYEWRPNDVCLPGCYYLEFKLMKPVDALDLDTQQQSSGGMWQNSIGECYLPSGVVPSFTNPSLTPADFGCNKGLGVEWMRRFPTAGEGFLVHIVDTVTAELI